MSADDSGISLAMRARPRRSPEVAPAPYDAHAEEFWEPDLELASFDDEGVEAPVAEKHTDLEREVATLRAHLTTLSTELERKSAELQALRALIPEAPAPARAHTEASNPAHRLTAANRVQSLASEVIAEAPKAPSSGPVLALSSLSVHLGSEGSRREGPRTKVALQVEFILDCALYAGLTEDISTGGVFVATYRCLPVGTEVSLEIELSNGQRLGVRGEVRWLREDRRAGGRPGMGIAWKALSPDALAALEQLSAHHAPLYVEV